MQRKHDVRLFEALSTPNPEFIKLQEEILKKIAGTKSNDFYFSLERCHYDKPILESIKKWLLENNIICNEEKCGDYTGDTYPGLHIQIPESLREEAENWARHEQRPSPSRAMS